MDVNCIPKGLYMSGAATPVYESITGAHTIPDGLRHYAISVITGPVLIDGVSVPTGYNSSLDAKSVDGILMGFDIDGSGGEIILTTVS